MDKPALKVVYSAPALQELDEIWNRNCETYGGDHANQYISFLKDQVRSLVDHPELGPPIEGTAGLRFLLIQWKTSAGGHIAVYRASKKTIRVLHIFHTAQDWQNKL